MIFFIDLTNLMISHFFGVLVVFVFSTLFSFLSSPLNFMLTKHVFIVFLHRINLEYEGSMHYLI